MSFIIIKHSSKIQNQNTSKSPKKRKMIQKSKFEDFHLEITGK